MMSVASTVLGGIRNDVTCTDALSTSLPFQPYLTGAAPSPIAVSTLKDKADTTEILSSICQCLKDATPELGVIPERAKQIPDLCKVELPAPVDPNEDCSK